MMNTTHTLAAALGTLLLCAAGCDEGTPQDIDYSQGTGDSSEPSAPGSGAATTGGASDGATGTPGATPGADTVGTVTDANGGSTGGETGATTGGGGENGGAASGENGGATGGEPGAGPGSEDTTDSTPTAGAGTFPPVAVGSLAAEGPYTAKILMNTGPNNAYTLYHPEELSPDGLKHPIVTWGSGGATTPDWYPLLPHLASHGFVVIATNSWPVVTGPQLKNGIDWLLAQNGDPSSPFYEKFDPENIAAMGYSMGSLATYEIGADPRLTTTVHIAGGIVGDGARDQVTALHAPAFFLCDELMTKPNCDGDFNVVNVPTFYGLLNGADHFSVVLDVAAMERIEYAVTGWLRLYLMGDESMRTVFEGSDCTLCSEASWTVQRKNYD